MVKRIRIDSDIMNHIKRLNLDGFSAGRSLVGNTATVADDKTIDLFQEIKEVVKENGASYDQTRKALIMVDESFYQNLLKKENPFKEKQAKSINEPKKEAIKVTQKDLERAELSIDPDLPEKLANELQSLCKEFFNKVLATKKELLPSMKEEELAFLHKKLNEFRSEQPDEVFDENFHIELIMTDAILITFSHKKLKSAE
ncbi:hypothetical protein FP329_002185 [Enterococcus faecium]|nr:hypothetical protein [Enterococcus faecium]